MVKRRIVYLFVLISLHCPYILLTVRLDFQLFYFFCLLSFYCSSSEAPSCLSVRGQPIQANWVSVLSLMPFPYILSLIRFDTFNCSLCFLLSLPARYVWRQSTFSVSMSTGQCDQNVFDKNEIAIFN
jgi:hypothetical protein